MADEKNVKKAEETKSAKSKKPSVFRRIGRYFRDTKGEFNKIVWPTFSSVVRNTLVTLALCAVLGALICLADLGLGYIIKFALMLG